MVREYLPCSVIDRINCGATLHLHIGSGCCVAETGIEHGPPRRIAGTGTADRTPEKNAVNRRLLLYLCLLNQTSEANPCQFRGKNISDRPSHPAKCGTRCAYKYNFSFSHFFSSPNRT